MSSKKILTGPGKLSGVSRNGHIYTELITRLLQWKKSEKSRKSTRKERTQEGEKANREAAPKYPVKRKSK